MAAIPSSSNSLIQFILIIHNLFVICVIIYHQQIHYFIFLEFRELFQRKQTTSVRCESQQTRWQSDLICNTEHCIKILCKFVIRILHLIEIRRLQVLSIFQRCFWPARLFMFQFHRCAFSLYVDVDFLMIRTSSNRQ